MEFYLYLFFALVLTLIADLGFALYTDQYVAGAWWLKNTLDLLWILGYLYWALGFGSLAISFSDAQQRLAKKLG
jgi:hypothetical protein